MQCKKKKSPACCSSSCMKLPPPPDLLLIWWNKRPWAVWVYCADMNSTESSSTRETAIKQGNVRGEQGADTFPVLFTIPDRKRAHKTWDILCEWCSTNLLSEGEEQCGNGLTVQWHQNRRKLLGKDHVSSTTPFLKAPKSFFFSPGSFSGVKLFLGLLIAHLHDWWELKAKFLGSWRTRLAIPAIGTCWLFMNSPFSVLIMHHMTPLSHRWRLDGCKLAWQVLRAVVSTVQSCIGKNKPAQVSGRSQTDVIWASELGHNRRTGSLVSLEKGHLVPVGTLIPAALNTAYFTTFLHVRPPCDRLRYHRLPPLWQTIKKRHLIKWDPSKGEHVFVVTTCKQRRLHRQAENLGYVTIWTRPFNFQKWWLLWKFVTEILLSL